MAWIATAAIGGSLISGGMALFGADKAANAQVDAANASKEIAGQTLDFQKQIYQEGVDRFKPFLDTGTKANSNIDKLINGGYDMNQSPAAQYQLTQGTKSLNRQLAARGLLGSGNAAQRLADLSSGIAATDYTNQYNRLLDQVKIGQGSASSAGSLGTVLGNQAGDYSTSAQQAETQKGQARSALWGSIGAAPTQMMTTGLNLYSGLKGL